MSSSRRRPPRGGTWYLRCGYEVCVARRADDRARLTRGLHQLQILGDPHDRDDHGQRRDERNAARRGDGRRDEDGGPLKHLCNCHGSRVAGWLGLRVRPGYREGGTWGEVLITWAMAGVFSSYAKQLEQGWRLLQEARTAPESAELQQTPRSFARTTKENLQLMITDYEAGSSAYELAEKYGHNRGTIMKYLAEAGIRS